MDEFLQSLVEKGALKTKRIIEAEDTSVNICQVKIKKLKTYTIKNLQVDELGKLIQ